MIGIVVSKEDIASMNIAKELLAHQWKEKNGVFFHKEKFLVFIDDTHLYHDNIDVEIKKKYGIKPKAIIFPSRHKAKAERKTLSVHPIGNYSRADFGGKEKELVLSAPLLMSQALHMLHQKKDIDYEICFEVTHHGPYLSTPTFFIEVGSTEKEWMDMDACKKIAEVLHEISPPSNKKIAIGIGGGHYAPRFTDIALKEGISFGHMIPEYHLSILNEKVAEKMIDATPGVKYAFFHGEGKKYRKLFEDLGLETF